MDDQHVMQRELTRVKHNVDRLRLIYLGCDLLAAGQKVVLPECVDMLELGAMRARNHAHAAVRPIARREGDPSGDNLRLAQTPVSRILMPGYESGVSRLLDEKAGAPAQDVRTQDFGNRIENLRMADEIVQPSEEQMGLVPQVTLDRTAAPPLVLLKALTEVCCSFGAYGVPGKVIAPVAKRGTHHVLGGRARDRLAPGTDIARSRFPGVIPARQLCEAPRATWRGAPADGAG